MSPGNDSLKAETPSVPLYVWCGPCATVLIGLALALPWLELRLPRETGTVTGVELLLVDKQLADDLTRLQGKAQERDIKVKARQEKLSGVRAKLDGRGKGIRKRLGQGRIAEARENVKEKRQAGRLEISDTMALMQDILAYAWYVVIAFLVIGVLPVVRLVIRGRSGVPLQFVFGLAGAVFAVSWIILAIYLTGIGRDEITVAPGTGLWTAAGGSGVLALLGMWWATATNAKVWLPLQLLPAGLWSVYLCKLLGMF